MQDTAIAELQLEAAPRWHRATRICRMCQAEFRGRGPQVQCSRACTDRAFYLAHKAERNAARSENRRRRRMEQTT